MRILIVSSIYVPGVGGSSRLLEEIADHLLQSGHHVEVLTFDLTGKAAEFDARQRYRIHRVKAQGRRGVPSLTTLGKLLALVARRDRFDLMLAGVAYPSAVLVRMASRLSRIPFAIYAHGEDVTAVEAKPLLSRLLGDALRGARLIMTNSNFTRRAILEHGAEPARVVCVHPWIDPSPYQAVSSEAVQALRARLGLQDKKVMLTLARLAPRKGHDTVIRALPAVVKRYPDAHYLVVGLGDAARLISLAEELGVSGNVRFVSYVEDAELPTLFAACDVYVMVSRWDAGSREVEGFGIVFLEAAACLKPSVAGSHGGSADAVEDGVTGYVVDPESPELVAGALLKLLDDPEAASRMGIAGRARVDQHFEKQGSLQRVEQLLLAQLSPRA